MTQGTFRLSNKSDQTSSHHSTLENAMLQAENQHKDRLVWMRSCIGGSDEHWQGFRIDPTLFNQEHLPIWTIIREQ